MLQLAAGDACLVAHLVSGDVCASGALADVLSDHTIAKVGVGLDDDAVELYNIDSRMKLSGRLDIGGPRKGRRIALREVAHRCIGGPIAPKAKKIACSNWAMRRLQSKQLAYAARDAWLDVVFARNQARAERARRTAHLEISELVIGAHRCVRA